MIALAPIEREFRAASRQKRLYSMRVATAIVLGVGLFWGVLLNAMQMSAGGAMAFAMLAIILFFLVSISIVSQSCGSISDEQRHGTLGLLLLTPLRPFDVVLGKFVTRMCEGLQLCLVGLPIIFVPFAMGGLTGGQIITAFIVILAQAMLCASASILGSVYARNPVITFIGAAFILGAAEGFGASLAGLFLLNPVWKFINPMAVVFRQFSMGPGDLTGSFVTLGFAVFLSWVMLSLAAHRLPHFVLSDSNVRHWMGLWGARTTLRSRCRADEKAPIYWLEWGRWNSKRNFFMGIFAALSACLLMAPSEGAVSLISIALTWTGSMLGFALSLMLVVTLIRRIQIQKQDRILEIIFTTPITDLDWVSQQFRASWAAFGIPILLVGILNAWSIALIPFSNGNGWFGLIPIGMSLLQILGLLATWYMLTAFSLTFGLSARSVGSGIGLLVLIYVGVHLICIPFIPALIAGLIAHNNLKANVRTRIVEAG